MPVPGPGGEDGQPVNGQPVTEENGARRTASGKTEFPWGGGSTAIGLSTSVDGGDDRESVLVSGVWL